MPTSFSISGGAIATPWWVRFSNTTRIEGDSIAGLSRLRSVVSKMDVRLSDSAFTFPALLNIPDHMRGNYLPCAGPSDCRFYTNWSDWNDNPNGSDTIVARNRALSMAAIYALNSYKDILAGTLAVQDHFPHEWNEPFVSQQPLTVVREYALAHDASRYALPWEGRVQREHRIAKSRGGHSPLTLRRASMPSCRQAWARWSRCAPSTTTP